LARAMVGCSSFFIGIDDDEILLLSESEAGKIKNKKFRDQDKKYYLNVEDIFHLDEYEI